MERKTKKVKKEGDTCRDCWTKRFRKDICDQWRIQLQTEATGAPEHPSDFLKRELQERDDIIKSMREEFRDIYDEIDVIEKLAGDIYMGRYKEEKD